MWVKSLISYFLMPFPLGLLLALVGLSLLWLTARQRTGRALVTAGAAVLLLCSWYPTSQWFLSPLHRRPPLTDPASAAAGARWVVVLGGGYETRESVPPTSRLSPYTLERLVEGIRVYRKLSGAKLIMSGRGYGELPTEAAVMQQAAEALGVPAADILQEGESDDTPDEARLIRPMVGNDRIVLVTSGVHMERSVRLFEKQGMAVVPAPAGFWPEHVDPWPNSDRLGWVQGAEHERLGILWARLHGAI
jgi:uncharacterized SAM-binding protein YcdF (DUF218 family)